MTLKVQICLKTYSYKRFENSDDPVVNYVIDYLKRNTRKLDASYYPVTYIEFNTLLNKYKVRLANESSQGINVEKLIRKKTLFGKEKEVWKPLGRIYFVGWRNRISRSAAKRALKLAKLTRDQGIDSKAFYMNANSLLGLIDEYHEPLRRLKDK